MICNKCGTQNSEASKFCIGCGNNLQNVQEVKDIIINNIEEIPTNKFQESSNLMMSEPVQLNDQIMNNQVPNNINVQPEVNNKNQVNKEKKPLNKKLLFIIGGAVLAILIIVVLLVVLLGKDKETKNISNLFDLEQPIPVYKEDGYVYIDTNGKMPKNIKYNSAKDFNGDFALVELSDGTAALIDKEQNVKVSATSSYAMEYISQNDFWLIDGVLYDSKLKAITDETIYVNYLDNGFYEYNNKDFSEYGIINNEGKKIYKTKNLIYQLEISESSISDEVYGVITLEEDSQYKEYVINLSDGKIVYENEYYGNELYQNGIYVDDNNIFYILDSQYNRVKTFYVKNNKIEYSINEAIDNLSFYGINYLEINYGYNYEELGKEQRYYYYDISKKEILKEEPKYEKIETDEKKDSAKRQIVSCGYGYGLIDDKNVIIPCIYDKVEQLPSNVNDYMNVQESKDLVYVEDDDKYFLYDANMKKEYIVFENAEDFDIYDSNYSLFVKQEIYKDSSWWSSEIEKTIVYNLLTGEKMEFDANSDIEIMSNYFTDTKNDKKMYYNMNFEKIYTEG